MSFEVASMTQSLLADRFKLKAHFETHEVPVLTLTWISPANSARSFVNIPKVRRARNTGIRLWRLPQKTMFSPRCAVSPE